MATIGQTLSAARIAAGCSLENLSTRTRIRTQVLRGIENEDFVPCGGDFYARGHIRRICKFLGLDPEPLLEEYDREHSSGDRPTFIPPPRHPSATPKAARVAAAEGGRAHTGTNDHEAPQEVRPARIGDEEADPEQRAESWGHFERNQRLARPLRRNRPKGAAATVPGPRRPGRHSKPENRPRDDRPAARVAVTRTRTLRGERVRRHWPWAVVGLILVTAVFVGVRTWQGWEEGAPVRTAFGSAGSNSEEGTGPSAARDTEAAGGAEGDAAGDAATEETGPAAGEADEFTVALTASERSWIRISDPAGEDLFTGFLTEGESQDHRTEVPLTLWVGNAGAIEVSVDGREQGPSGGPGEVKEVTVGADGLVD
ncbi:RodZ domain-containing protein [Nocardiopsis terrae]